jgi:hypothetical protein
LRWGSGMTKHEVARLALVALAPAVLALAGCAQEPSAATADLGTGEEFVEDGEIVPEGKADDFLSATAREFVIAGSDTVTLESTYSTRSTADRLARARQLVGLRQTALAWFLNQYLVDKEEDEANHAYGGFGAMAKAGDYTSANIRPESTGSLTYRFDFEQLVAGRTNLMTLIPTQSGPNSTRTFTLTVGLPTNAQMGELETNHEWYRSAPWSEWSPTTVPAAQRRDLTVTLRPETASHDVWFDYDRLFADGVLDIDVHFGWDYHAGYHVTHAHEMHDWLRAQGFTAPVRTFDALNRTSGAYTRTIRANGRDIRIEVRLFYGHAGGDTDPDTDAGGRQLEADARTSLATRDVIVYSGHSGPFYGFALANWRMTDEGDLDDSEMASVRMASGRYQIVVAEGCDTYQIGEAFSQNPAHPNLRDLNVLTTTSFSNASTPATVQDFISHLIERDSRGHHRPRTVRSLLTSLDAESSSGFHTMYGIHGVDHNPSLHPYADHEMMGQACSANADCGDLGNLCIRPRAGAARVCTAACTDDSGCGTGMVCRQLASASSRTIYGSACVAR